jgi:hypothetical protein
VGGWRGAGCSSATLTAQPTYAGLLDSYLGRS